MESPFYSHNEFHDSSARKRLTRVYPEDLEIMGSLLLSTTDRTRRIFLCVGDLVYEEARQLCATLHPPMPATEEELQMVFEKIGTRPAMLIDLHRQLLWKKVCPFYSSLFEARR
jgi:hypothetical protein